MLRLVEFRHQEIQQAADALGGLRQGRRRLGHGQRLLSDVDNGFQHGGEVGVLWRGGDGDGLRVHPAQPFLDGDSLRGGIGLRCLCIRVVRLRGNFQFFHALYVVCFNCGDRLAGSEYGIEVAVALEGDLAE